METNSIEFKPGIELVAIDGTVFHPLGGSLPSPRRQFTIFPFYPRERDPRFLPRREEASIVTTSPGFPRARREKRWILFQSPVENPKRITHALERLAGVAKKKNSRQKVCFIHDLRTGGGGPRESRKKLSHWNETRFLNLEIG